MKRTSLLVCLSLLIISLSAQLPVSKEPRHHVVFENKQVRVLNVLLAPGDTTFYHLHSTPSVFINLSKTKTGSQLINEQPLAGSSVAGNIYVENLSAPHTRYHRVWNVDTAMFHVVDVELLSTDSGFTQQPLQLKYAPLLIDTPWVRVYKITLGKTEKITLHETQRSFLIIALKETAIDIMQNNKQLKGGLPEGGFIWVNAGDSFTLSNQQKAVASFALLELMAH
jgi:hypothetical protein